MAYEESRTRCGIVGRLLSQRFRPAEYYLAAQRLLARGEDDPARVLALLEKALARHAGADAALALAEKLDHESYKIRFTPRRAKSTWSAVNIARVAVLTCEGRMQPAGIAAFARREENNSRRYSFENRAAAKLAAADEQEFRRHRAAWDFFRAQPAGYRRLAAWWVISAKRPETRRKRLERLIQQSLAKRRI